MHVWVDAPLTTRVTLNMMGFDGREVGRSAKSFEVQHVLSTHRLSAKGSRDASLRVESTRAWRFYCGCLRGRATLGPCNAQDNAFGWASSWFMCDISDIIINMLISIKILIMKVIMKLNKQMSSFNIYMIMCVGVPLRARTVLEMVHLDGRAGWRTRELRALSEVLLRASFVCKGIP